jgi:hypothetical protein
MFSHTVRASVALQLARVAAPAVALGAVVLVVGACSNQDRPVAGAVAPNAVSFAANGLDDGTYFGTTVPLGPGIARTYVTIEGGTPVEIGVELNKGALEGLPTTGAHDGHNNEHHQRGHSWELPLPEAAASTAYKSVNIGWMPNGHEAPYNRPHLDFHFYVIPTAERLAIDPSDPQWAQKAGAMPPPAFWPARYFPLSMLINKPAAEVSVPGMGMHWLDIASPELYGAEFTHTLFYGSWNGAIIFDEPMITKKLLESRETVDVTLPPAADYATTGYRAGGYRVYFDAESQRHRVALAQLSER